MANSTSQLANRYWIKFSVCCVWLALALLPRFVDLDKLRMQVNLHGLLLLTSVIIEATSPIALIWLFMLLREQK